MAFLSALRKYLHPPVRHTLPPALFPTQECTLPVGEWASSIQNLPENEDCRILRIVHCKAKSTYHEEFLLVYIRHPSGKDAIVLAERGTRMQKYGTLVHPSDGQRSPASRDCIRLSPNDNVASLTGHIPGGWAEIHTAKFAKASKAPSVAHLAVLLTVVHRHVLSSSASVEGQSGWFAYCVGEILKEIFSGSSKTNFKETRVPYGGVKVDGRDTVNTLILEFRSAWEDFSRRQSGVRSTERYAKQRTRHNAEPFVDMLRAMNT